MEVLAVVGGKGPLTCFSGDIPEPAEKYSRHGPLVAWCTDLSLLGLDARAATTDALRVHARRCAYATMKR